MLGAALRSVVERVAQRYPGHKVWVHMVEVPLYARLIDPVIKPFAFAKKQAVLDANKALFADFDVLVVPEKTSLKLKREPGLEHLKIVYTHHGAGDRAEAYYPELAQFDLVLAPGPKITDRLLASGLVKPENCAIVGYPKFSVIQSLGAPYPRLPSGRKTVLYNPHYSRRESSWPTMGRAVLEYFGQSDRYNLIFAPHVLLYQRWFRHRARPLGRWRAVPHMHLDTGSDAVLDMTYMDGADIYLGDVSSQIYEFLHRPRPAIFLDARGVEGWQDDDSFKMWHAGDVVRSMADLPKALAEADARHGHYLPMQKSLFQETFDLTDRPSERRAANAIVDHFVNGTKYGKGVGADAEEKNKEPA
ncbi:glycerophosphotransferase [Iodidimonas gelatinilytica]|uniref:Glycerophosphotransferase n=2 Tax=Iodidimonas gelatinilytica TaxID=1236966 RepID=A0A5A7MQB3_9PROT|nr:hypothetical protein [Iodidimonas gelatinilytica]GEQ97145.1 glycerophosphotransferase [Iodidimonas gelatinilytica]